MILPRKKHKNKESEKFNVYQELINYINENNYGKFFLYILNNIGKITIDEKMFFFIYRQTKPFLIKFYNQNPKLKIKLELTPLKVFSKIIQQSNFKFSSFLLYLSESEINNIFDNLKSTNDEVYEVSRSLIESICYRFREASSMIQEIISNDLINFYKFQQHHRAIEFELLIIKNFILNNTIENNFEIYFEQFILPIIIHIPYFRIDFVASFIDCVCSRISICQKLILKFFAKSFLKYDSNDQIKIIELTTCVLRTYFFKEVFGLIDLDFSETLNCALKSENYLVIDAAIEMLSDIAIKRFIEIHRKTVIPYIFDSLYKLSKKFWKQEQKCKAIQAIGNILNIDVNVFEECLINYNKRKFYKNSEDPTLDNEKIYNDRLKNIYFKFDE